MPDDADIAGEQSAPLMAAAVKAVAMAEQARKEKPSLTRCLECGSKIPEKRRLAQEGCELCVECQSWKDKGGGFWP